jgi:hypothetical protein
MEAVDVHPLMICLTSETGYNGDKGLLRSTYNQGILVLHYHCQLTLRFQTSKFIEFIVTLTLSGASELYLNLIYF